MDALVKQRRRRVSISENQQTDLSRLSELSITDYPALNWLKNQSYWYEKNDVYNEKASEFAASVAAAAFVIISMEEADKEKAIISHQTKRSRTKKTIPVIPKPEAKRQNKSFTQEVKIGEESSRKTPLEYPPKNRHAQEIGSSSRILGLASAPSKPDSWEISQMKKIRLRYEKMKAEIVGWENERKLAAKLRMEKRKSVLEKRKELNNQHYKSKLATIHLIADGAKKQLEDKRRGKEAQLHQKVKKMHRSGKVPINYFCFRCY